MAKAHYLLIPTLILVLCGCGSDNTPPTLSGANPASTGPAPVAATGQSKCYNAAGTLIECAGTGQDGDLRKGAAIPSPRFTDNGDGTVTDNLSGLMWTKESNCILGTTFDTDGMVSWDQGLLFATKVNDHTYNCNLSSPADSYADWRLPNRNELRSLVDIKYYWPAVSNRAGTGKWTTGDPFNGVIDGTSYMTSTTDINDKTKMWAVDLTTGIVATSPKASTNKVWLVRDGGISAPAPTAATGQSKCYDSSGTLRVCAGTGEDGELQKGVAIPSPRFTDNGDGTVSDKLTGLMWLKDVNCIGNRYPSLDTDTTASVGDGDGEVSWQHGLDFISGLNYGAHDCGQNKNYTDWRMPNYNEINSLVNPMWFHPALSNAAGSGQWSSGDPFTGLNAPEMSDNFWTSDTVENAQTKKEFAWRISMSSGIMSNTTTKEANTAYLWPVRGGN